jgi:hypothetical protein
MPRSWRYVMSRIVRQCGRCGHFDDHQHWASLDQAAAAGATEQNWACPRCSWPEFNLVEEAGELAEAQVERGSKQPPPLDPDEARRRAQQILPFR